MCGRFVLKADLARILEGFGAVLREPQEFVPRYNIAPTQQVPVVVPAAEGARELRWLRWGLVPSWSKDATHASSLINARAETAAEKPSFRGPFRNRRCVVPANGFYEWKKSPRGKGKTPHFIEVEGQPLFAMAGLWDSWEVRDDTGKKTGELLDTFTILTVDATEDVQAIHDRMPRILSCPELDSWLDPHSDPAKLAGWIAQPPGRLHLHHRPVTREVNSPRNDSPALLETPPETDLFGNPSEG